MKKFFKSKYFIGSLLVTVLYIAFLYIADIIPFGDKSILKTDLFQQYAEFLANYKDILLHKKGLLVSWNMGLANNYYTIFTYYLASPFNLLVVLFNKNDMYIFVELVTYLKILTIYNCVTFYLEKSFDYKKTDLCMFGLIYTFSSYVICYLFHIMWLDAVYILPIVLLCVEKYIKNGKMYPFIIVLALSILFNYYMGFIIAIFAGAYFVIRVLTVKKINVNIVKDIVKFIIGELIAIGISMIFFLPSFMQMKSNMKMDIDLLDIKKDSLVLLSNVIFNNYKYMFAQKAGLVFTSTLTILLFPMFYGNKAISKKEKVLSSLLVIFMLLPIVSPIFNRIWHGMTSPNMFYYRYAFCTQLFLVVIGLRVYGNKELIQKKDMVISLIVFYLLTSIEIIFNIKGMLTSDDVVVSNTSIIVSCLVFQVLWTLLYLKLFTKKDITKKVITACITITVVVDLTISITSYHKNNYDGYFSVEAVTEYDELMEEFMLYVESPVTDRVIFNPSLYSNNFSQKYGYSTIGYFTSARNKNTIRNMYTLGYNIQRDEALWLTSYSGTWINYSLAGVKYYISELPLEENEIYGFKLIDRIKDKYYVYENELTIPFVSYQTDKITIEQEIGPFECKNKNPFELQNDILKNISNNDKTYLYSLDNSSKIVNVQKNIYGDKTVYDLEALEDTNLYVFGYNNLQLYKDGQPQFEKYADLWSIETGIKPIKHLNKGEKYSFEIETDGKADVGDKNIAYVYATDNNLIANLILQMKTYKVNIDKIGLNEIDVTINADNDGYANFEIAFDEGWRATVNGKNQIVEKTNGAFTGVQVTKGENKIHLYFVPRYLKLGALLTITSLSLLIIIIIIEERIWRKDAK